MSSAAGARARAHLRIHGRVQGVGFRYAMANEARLRQLAGWVRNLDTGEVEAVCEGPRPAVESLVGWCREGPTGAWVAGVTADWEEALEDLSRFEVRASGYGARNW